jgi:hypothetical protein
LERALTSNSSGLMLAPLERAGHAGEHVGAVERAQVVEVEGALEDVGHRELLAEGGAVGVVVADEGGELGAVVGAVGDRVAVVVGLDLDAVDPQLLPQELAPAVDVVGAAGEAASDHGAAVDAGGVELLDHADEDQDLAHALGLAALDQRDEALDEGLVAGVAVLGLVARRGWFAVVVAGLAGAGAGGGGVAVAGAGLGGGGAVAGRAAAAIGVGADLGGGGVVVGTGDERGGGEAEGEEAAAGAGGLHGGHGCLRIRP